MAFVSAPAMAERRVALVIGNSAYKNAPKLPNPANDAEAIAAMLKRQRFEVVLGLDLDRDGFFATVDKFADVARGADAAVFYYAGHGLQIDGKNLLVPVEARLKSEIDAKRNTVEVDMILNQTMGDAKVKLVLLDSCRENPFAAEIAEDQRKKTRSVTVREGFAEMRPGEGTIIQFATAAGELALDGKAGEHSPFTRALLQHLAKPEIEIQHALTLTRAQVVDETRRGQQPWYSTNITGFFYMDKAKRDIAIAAIPRSDDSASSAAEARLSANAGTVQKEILFWESIKASRDVDDFKAYLDQYPTGTYAGLARNRVRELTKAPSGADRAEPVQAAAAADPRVAPTATIGDVRTAEASLATEDALGLDRDAWRNVQRRVRALGHGSGKIDGKPRDGTRQGVRAWQIAKGYPSSGYLNKLQYDALLAEPISAAALAAKSDSGGSEDDRPRTRSTGAGQGSQPRQTSRHQPGDGAAAAAGAAGEFIGGLVRGATKGRLPF